MLGCLVWCHVVVSVVLVCAVWFRVRRVWLCFFFFQAEDGIRDLVRSRGLGDVYKRQGLANLGINLDAITEQLQVEGVDAFAHSFGQLMDTCLLYTSDAADERSSVDLGGRRIIKKKNNQ